MSSSCLFGLPFFNLLHPQPGCLCFQGQYEALNAADSAVLALEPSWRPCAGSEEKEAQEGEEKVGHPPQFVLGIAARLCSTWRCKTRLLDAAAGRESGGAMSHHVKVTSRPCASLQAGGADLSTPSCPHGRPQVCLTRMLQHRLLSARPKPVQKNCCQQAVGECDFTCQQNPR